MRTRRRCHLRRPSSHLLVPSPTLRRCHQPPRPLRSHTRRAPMRMRHGLRPTRRWRRSVRACLPRRLTRHTQHTRLRQRQRRHPHARAQPQCQCVLHQRRCRFLWRPTAPQQISHRRVWRRRRAKWRGTRLWAHGRAVFPRWRTAPCALPSPPPRCPPVASTAPLRPCWTRTLAV